jgi:hypothetical protein
MEPAMTLLEAFRVFGVLIEDPSVDGQRQVAAGVLLQEMNQLVRGLGFRHELKEDAVHIALCRLMTGGNRSTSALECDSDARARGFLRECLRNVMLDEIRRSKRLSPIDPETVESISDPQQSSPEEEAVAWQEIDLRASAERELREVLVPLIASRLRISAGRDFVQAVDHMCDLADGKKDFNTVVLEATGHNDSDARTAVHQRHSRARRRLLQIVDEHGNTGSISADRLRAMRWSVSRLHRRASYL